MNESAKFQATKTLVYKPPPKEPGRKVILVLWNYGVVLLSYYVIVVFCYKYNGVIIFPNCETRPISFSQELFFLKIKS